MHLPCLLPLLPLALASPTIKRSEPAPLLIPRGEASDLIANEYIVKLKKGTAHSSLQDTMNVFPGEPIQVFDSIFQGFTANLDSQTLEAMRAHPDVDYIEQNAKVEASAIVTQTNAPWGLARISHVKPGSSKYLYDSTGGAGTCVYIVDSGVDTKHKDFEGRAEELVWKNGASGDRCDHGTHVAGSAGGVTYGVAKKANIYGVKVLGITGAPCDGAYSDIIAGLDFIPRDAATRSCPKGVVVNISLRGPFSQAMNDAAAALVKKGFFVVAAAGNDATDASRWSPASEPSVCTVGATDSSDRHAWFSNFGPLVDIYGPGVDVLSAQVGGGSFLQNGTSMAAPHISGIGAYYMGLGKPASGMCARLQGLGLNGVISGVPPKTTNLLGQNGIGA